MAERILPDWAAEDQEHVIWLDDDHAVTWSSWPGETEPHGGVLWHRKPDSNWCRSRSHRRFSAIVGIMALSVTAHGYRRREVCL